MMVKSTLKKLTADPQKQELTELKKTHTTLEKGISIYIRSKDETKDHSKKNKKKKTIFMHRTNKMINMKQLRASFVDMKNCFMNYLCMIKQIMIS